MNQLKLTAVLLSVLALGACNKPVEVIQPVAVPIAVPGPAGATGSTGATGATGDTGAKGNTGNSGTGTTVIVTPPAAASGPTN